MSMYNLNKPARPSSGLVTELPASAPKEHMDMISSIALEGDNLSMTVVLQPSKKQSLRLSFPGNYPIEQYSNSHRRLESEDSVESRRGYTLYSQESLGNISDSSDDHIDMQGKSPIYDQHINSHISLSNCYNRDVPRPVQPATRSSVSSHNSTDSEVDPYLDSQRALVASPPKQCAEELRKTEISDGVRFAQLSEPATPPRQTIVRQAAKKPHVTLEGHMTPMELVRTSPASKTRRGSGKSTSPDIIDQFPSPPPTRTMARLPIRRINSDTSSEDGFADWLQQVQDRFVSRQSSISKNDAIIEFKHSILRSYNTTTLDQELSLGVDTGPLHVSNLDFDTYHGLTNDMRKSTFDYPDAMLELGMRPLSVCNLPTVTRQSIQFCEEMKLTDAEEMKERKELMKRGKLDEAEMCKVRDQQGNRTLFKDVIRHRQTIVIFLRFFWCAKCQDYVRSISKFFAPGTEARQKLDDTNTTVVFIGTGSWKMIASYKAMLNCSFEFYTDTTTTSKLFRKMGLHRILLGGSSDPAKLHKTLTIWQTMVQSAKSIPKLPIHHPGSFTQLGGEFCFQNFSADYSPPTTPIVKKPIYNHCIPSKLSLKCPRSQRKALLDAPVMEHITSDPFRRSLLVKQPEKVDVLPSPSTVRCIYANRMKSSASHGTFSELFKSAGVDFPAPEINRIVTIEEPETS
ncbi:hypothetical protein MJO29_012065 [Puccinia striiformis f. sp. tritici]|uniref:Uncharacterized protein n=1 Tax=Puccinia striiformis f. sp. tritici PST-78 TaxID=1165861 RepID=A0A0L0V8Z3_9BASI|nr:hypothetical protein MJO29_012065 [Puccinia striiformis f. sp. tritici]KNE95760.1 hypothetical protein PSTG_10976 [Puccinia striiformis f. sp. tritici PST-78]